MARKGQKAKGSNILKKDQALPKGVRTRIKLLFAEPIAKDHLEAAIKRLQHKVRQKRPGSLNKKEQHCLVRDTRCSARKENYYSDAVQLRARSSCYINDQLRNAILLHDWDSAASLLSSLIKVGNSYYHSQTLRACFVLICNHPKATPELLRNFLSKTTGYTDNSDIEKFAMILCSIRDRFMPSTGNKPFIDVKPALVGKLVNNENYTQLPVGGDSFNFDIIKEE